MRIARVSPRGAQVLETRRFERSTKDRGTMAEQDHILVVEDEPITREQLVSYFEDEGFKVSQTGSGDEVVDIVNDSDIILVLLDIKLPGKDGLTLTREIRANSDIGIILDTSKQEQIDRILGLESGADD